MALSNAISIDPKYTVYKTLVRKQLEYASSVWSPHTDEDIEGSLDHRWVTNAKVQANIKCLQCFMISTGTSLTNLVAIPVSAYLIRNTRQSSRNPSLACRQNTVIDYYKYILPTDNHTVSYHHTSLYFLL